MKTLVHKVMRERTTSSSADHSASIPLRVLILDNNPQDAEMAIIELRNAGLVLQADVVDTEVDFTSRLQSRVYDLILSDFRLPAWSGVDAFHLLRQSGKDIPFILVTGTLGEEAAVDLIKEGVADYVLKDRLARLPVAVRRALEEKSTCDERERAIQALRDSEERVRLLLNTTAEAICGTDIEGNCTFCNPSSLRLLGYDRPDDLLGKQMHRLMHHTRADGSPYPLEQCQIHARSQIGEGSHADDEFLWRKDGTSFPAEYWSYPVVRDGKPIGVVVTFLDITERKRAEQELRKTEARVRHLVESNIIGIAIGDLNGNLIEANGAFLKLVGYSREDLLSGEMRWDALTPPEYRDSDQRAVEQLRTTGIASPREKQFLRKDSSRISVLIGVTSLVGEDGVVEHVSCVVDISEQKKLEQQLRQAQKMEAIGQLAGGIAHDFNNLLSVIIGYSEILLDSAPREGKMRIQCEEIAKAGDRAASLTRQLLAFSRQQVLAPRVLNLNTVVIETEKMLKRLIGEDIELRTTLDPALSSVKADPGQIAQVIMNLAVNARDAMPEGGKLIIETSNAEIDDVNALHYLPPGGNRYVLLAVTDTGGGMDEETKSHIFEPFFTTKGIGRGTGLGLSTVYGVVKQSGGYLWASSELGHGSVFKIYLPRVDESVDQSPPSQPAPEQYRGTETILLVEDEKSVRTLTRSILEDGGYTVIDASSGNHALAAATKHSGPIHLLLTDMVMPGMNGRMLAEKMIAVRPGIRVLYVSGYTGNISSYGDFLDVEVSLVQKPFSRITLLQKLREVLDVQKISEPTHRR
jgi:two-component system, cell cycle sensor histidine kinase and response regulator CckA